jgi:hypothetical protein
MGEVVVPRNFRASASAGRHDRRAPPPRTSDDAPFKPNRNFCRRRTPLPAQLLDELEKFEKGLTGDMNVSAGAPPAPPGPRDRRAATRGDRPQASRTRRTSS